MRKLWPLLILALLLAGCQIVPTPCPTCPTCAPTLTPRPTRTPTSAPTATVTPTPQPTWDGAGFKANAAPELIGVCQGDGSHGAGGNNWYYISGQSVAWKFVETAPGVYNFQAPDPSGYLGQSPISAVATTTALNDKALAQGKDPFYVWLQLGWWSPGNDWIPAHVTVERLPYVGNPGDGSFPNPFDARLISQMEPVVREYAAQWDSNPRVSAWLAYLGEYGELNAKYVCKADTPAHKADCGSEPDNVLILAAIRRVKAETGETVTPAQMIASYSDGSAHLWQHRWQRELFVYYVKPMLEMYRRHWTHTPIVVQLGNMSEWHFGSAHCGADDPGSADCWSLVEQVMDWVGAQGPAYWGKQNGAGNSSTYAYAALMGRYAGKTRVIWEPGNTIPSGDMLNAEINTGKASALCYQAWMIEEDFAIPLAQQKAMLRANYETYYWPLVRP